MEFYFIGVFVFMIKKLFENNSQTTNEKENTKNIPNKKWNFKIYFVFGNNNHINDRKDDDMK